MIWITKNKITQKRLLARSLNKVKLVRSRRSSTGLAARLGPGSNWQRVLSIIPWDRWVLSLNGFIFKGTYL